MIIYGLSTTDPIRGMLEVGTFAEFPVVDALEWAFECGLPIELTVGLTMSLTGNYSDESIWDEWDELESTVWKIHSYFVIFRYMLHYVAHFCC